MKVVVLKPFRDKYTKALYKPKQRVEMSEERVKEIADGLGNGFIETVAKKENKKGV